MMHAIDQIYESTFQIRDVLAQTQEGLVEIPKARGTFGMATGVLMNTSLFPLFGFLNENT